MTKNRAHYDEMSSEQKQHRLRQFADKKNGTGAFDRLMQEIGRRLKGQRSVRSRFGWAAFMVGDKSIRSEDEFDGDFPLKQAGHILVEDKPGVGKTLLGEIIGRALGGTFERIQGTEDLLPSHIRGFEAIFRTNEGDVRKTFLGPAFSNVFLFDEMNRASGLVHAGTLDMTTEEQVGLYTFGKELDEEELRRLTEGPAPLRESAAAKSDTARSRHLFEVSNPFMLIGTQNPFDSRGTNYLPEASLDRFAMKVLMEALLPHDMDEIQQADSDPELTVIRPVLSLDEWWEMRRFIFYAVTIHPRVQRYISRLALAIEPYPRRPDQVRRLAERLERMQERDEAVDRSFLREWETLYTREVPVHDALAEQTVGVRLDQLVDVARGVRTGLFLRRLAKVCAACEGRLFVLPEDVRKVAPDVMRHRFMLNRNARPFALTFEAREALIQTIVEFVLDSVAVPARDEVLHADT